MKIKPASNFISGNDRGFSPGKITVEMFLFLVAVFFAVSYGIDWVKGFQSRQLTDVQVREMAQRIVFVAEAAERAGVDLIIDGDITATVERISRGGTARFGEYRGQFFGVPELTEKAKDRVQEHLQLHGDRLTMKQFESYASLD